MNQRTHAEVKLEIDSIMLESFVNPSVLSPHCMDWSRSCMLLLKPQAIAPNPGRTLFENTSQPEAFIKRSNTAEVLCWRRPTSTAEARRQPPRGPGAKSWEPLLWGEKISRKFCLFDFGCFSPQLDIRVCGLVVRLDGSATTDGQGPGLQA